MKEFEFRLGKLGLVLFVIGISFLILLSFVAGVMVGVNMEGNPDQIAEGIPGILKQKVARSNPAEGGGAEKGEGSEGKKAGAAVKGDFASTATVRAGCRCALLLLAALVARNAAAEAPRVDAAGGDPGARARLLDSKLRLLDMLLHRGETARRIEQGGDPHLRELLSGARSAYEAARGHCQDRRLASASARSTAASRRWRSSRPLAATRNASRGWRASGTRRCTRV